MQELMTDKRPKIIVIAGPTASGKTKTAYYLADDLKKYFDSVHIINADAMAVYKDMIIGTAAPTKEEKEKYPHYLFNFVDVDFAYSVHNYREDVEITINSILSANRNPLLILVGGSGQYISSLVENIQYANVNIDESKREELNRLYDADPKLFYTNLLKLDACIADRIHPNDKKRLVRAMEIMSASKQTMSYHLKKSTIEQSPWHFYCIFANEEREFLKERIKQRIESMFKSGFIAEVENITKKITFDNFSSTSQKAIGYAEIVDYINNKQDLAEITEKIYIRTCQLAKRQSTWFRHKSYMQPYSLLKDYPQILIDVKEFLSIS